MVREVAVEGLSMSYGGIGVWDGLDLSLGGPGLTCILGPNGVGKSTLMRALDRLAVPDSGTVSMDGDDIEAMSRRDLARRVAFVPAGSEEAFSMTVLDAVMMGRHPRTGFGSRAEDVEIAARCMRMMGIEDMAARRLDRLSAGQHQKAMIARGLAQEPEVLLLDEPTANLDLRHQLEVMKLLHDVAIGEGILVIAICHDINVAARFADRIVLLNDGAVIADGPPKDVITPDNMRIVYGIDCDVIEASGRPYIVYYTDHLRSLLLRTGPGCHKYKCHLNLRIRRRHEDCSICRS